MLHLLGYRELKVQKLFFSESNFNRNILFNPPFEQERFKIIIIIIITFVCLEFKNEFMSILSKESQNSPLV